MKAQQSATGVDEIAAMSPGLAGDARGRRSHARDLQRIARELGRGAWPGRAGRRLGTRRLAAATVIAITIVMSLVFIILDHRAASWDQAHYLDLAYRYDASMLSGGVPSFIHQLRSLDPGRAPLYSILLMPGTELFGSSFRTALLLNLVLWVLLLYSVYSIANRLFSPRAGVLAMVLTATIPDLVGLSHEVLQDFLVVTATTTILMLVLQSESFTLRRPSILLGLSLGLGALAKVTTLLYVLAPIAVCTIPACMSIVRDLREPLSRTSARDRFLNVAMAFGIGAAISLLWYIPALQLTLDYLRVSATGNAASDRFSVTGQLRFALQVTNGHIGWIIVLGGLTAAAVLLAEWMRRPLATGLDWRRAVFRTSFLASWILVPLLTVGLSNNQEPRYLVSALPAVPIIVAGLLVAIRMVRVRRALIGITAAACIYQSTLIVLARDPLPGTSRVVTWWTPVGQAELSLNGGQIGANRRPVPDAYDFPTPIVDYLEYRSNVNGIVRSHSVGLLESEPWVNGNTLTYVVDVRNDPFIFRDILTQPLSQLRTTLDQYDFLLIIPAASVDPHQVVIDSQFAADELTPDLLAGYRHRATFVASPGELVEVLDRLP